MSILIMKLYNPSQYYVHYTSETSLWLIRCSWWVQVSFEKKVKSSKQYSECCHKIEVRNSYHVQYNANGCNCQCVLIISGLFKYLIYDSISFVVERQLFLFNDFEFGRREVHSKPGYADINVVTSHLFERASPIIFIDIVGTIFFFFWFFSFLF